MSETVNKIFKDEEVATLLGSQGKELHSVLIYLWQNKSGNESLEIIDAIKFILDDNIELTLTCDPESESITLTSFDFLEYKRQHESEINDSIIIHEVNAGTTGMWKDTIKKKLKAVLLTKTKNGYASDSIVFDFEGEKRLLSINPLDGLLLDYYED
ncbi:MAG: hypothetical protein AB7O73_00745 [Bacteroidia bacterium]